MARDPVTPADVRLAMAHCVTTLGPHADDDWSVPAGTLEWDCRTTLTHIAHAVDRYGLYLAGQWQERLPFQLAQYPECSVAQLLRIAELRAAALSQIAASAAPDTRAYHAWGRPDWSGYVAMGVVEILLHTDDIAVGLAAASNPPADLCARTLARLFPWAPDDVDPWRGLQWATGRAELAGYGRTPPDWAWHASPVSEWDGTIKTHASYKARS